MKSLVKPLFISVSSLLLLNLLTTWMLGLPLSALVALSGSALIAFALAFGFFYSSNTAPLHRIIDLVHCRLADSEGKEKHCSEEDLQALLESTDPMVHKMGEIDLALREFFSNAAQLAETSNRSAISAAEVSYSVSELRKKLEIQAQEIGQVADSSEEITTIGLQVAEHSREAKSCSLQAYQDSTRGQEVLNDTHNKISNILTQTEQAYDRIEALSQNSDKIKAVTQVIDDIADQTNLLALNAAIEAARAGEMGRGFAVVADEVRGLAARTTEATREVGQIIDENHRETEQVVDLFKNLAEEVRQGTGYIHDIAETLGDVSGKVADVEHRIGEIAQHAASNHEHLQAISGAIQTLDNELHVGRDHIQQLDREAEIFTNQAEQANASLAELNVPGLHRRVFSIARQGADKIAASFEGAVANGTISMNDLFDRNYRKMENTEPAKYHTRFDGFADRVLPAIQEAILNKHGFLTFAIATDENGYVPTHNERFSQPLTGDPKKDLAGNRTKRIFNDRTGARCGSHTQRLLLQTYKRDTGEIMHDLSVPIYVNGRHWGGFRIGYVS